jgi:hypothetical protein
MTPHVRITAAWLAAGFLAVGCVAPATARAADDAALPAEPAAAAAPQEPAADGTKSVVVPATDESGAASAPATVPPPVAAPLAGGLPVAAPATAPPPVAQPPVTSPPVSQPPSVLAPPAAAAGVPPVNADAAAEDLLTAALEPPAAGTAAIRPVALLEAVESAGDPSRRLWIVQAYWKVAASFAAVHWSRDAVERLELVAPGADPHDRAVLDVATAAARADLAEAQVRLGVAQQELVDLSRLTVADAAPWPVDRPLVGPYQTHFDAIFANRMATGRVRAIARTLPARHEALEARAAAARAAAEAAAMAEADHAQGRRPIEAVTAAHTALVGQRREFLEAVKAYNLDIAEYAMAVADTSVPADRFVSMLIGTPVQVRPQPAGLTAPPAVPALPAEPAAVPAVPLQAAPVGP